MPGPISERLGNSIAAPPPTGDGGVDTPQSTTRVRALRYGPLTSCCAAACVCDYPTCVPGTAGVHAAASAGVGLVDTRSHGTLCGDKKHTPEDQRIIIFTRSAMWEECAITEPPYVLADRRISAGAGRIKLLPASGLLYYLEVDMCGLAQERPQGFHHQPKPAAL